MGGTGFQQQGQRCGIYLLQNLIHVNVALMHKASGFHICLNHGCPGLDFKKSIIYSVSAKFFVNTI